jgi:dipeptidase D
MAQLDKLVPQGIWQQFEAITRIPRPSKKEEKIRRFLVDFAEQHGLAYKTDEIGNVVILKSATAGMESRPTVVLQSHIDMVCEKNTGAVNSEGERFDFERDAIQTVIDGDWVRADGTTLGADDGIGMAAALALLIDPTVAHGPLEALFTVDEETGLTGAFNLGGDMISGKYLVNLDSEDEGEVFIGCAGGVDTLAYFDYTAEPTPSGYRSMRLSVSELKGGHSGDDIDKGLGNSNRILARALWEGIERFSLRLSAIDGGNLRNAIPREASAVVALPDDMAADFEAFFERFAADVRAELQYTDPAVTLTLESAPEGEVIDEETTRNLTLALMGVPNGVQAMSFAMPGLVETSTNLASVKMAGGQILVTTSQRSSVESAKHATAAAVEAVFRLAGARVEHSEGYPGWAPNPHSHILEVTERAYENLFGTKAKVRAIHAGLECGLFLEKYPQLEMVSIGPTLRGVHSPTERLEIPSVDKFWRLLVEMLGTIQQVK